MPNPSPLNRLMQHIRVYESDTFSASASDMTDVECLMVCEALIHQVVTTMIGGALDGVGLTAILDDIRGQ